MVESEKNQQTNKSKSTGNEKNNPPQDSIDIFPSFVNK